MMIYNKKSLVLTTIAILISIFTPLAIESVEAREVYPLNQNWKIYAAADGSADNANHISLPYCWSHSARISLSHATVDYLRTIYAPQEWESKRVFIKFHGVQSSAELFINGRFVGEHRGGSTAFVFEITDQVRLNNNNDLVIRVNSIPRNDLLPTSVEHEIYSGIYRDVELIVTPQTAFSPNIYGADGLFVTTTSIENNTVKGNIKVLFTTKEEVERAVTLKIHDAEGNEQFSKTYPKWKVNGTNILTAPFEVKEAQLWSIDNPALYTVSVEMIGTDSKKEGDLSATQDQISTITGFRTISVSLDGGVKDIVKINGQTQLFRGVSYQHDNPEKGGSTSIKLLKRDVAQLQELGANAIRSAVSPHDRALYSICDREGIMVWIDTPFARAPSLSDVGYYPTTEFENNGIQQLKEIVYQNYNHPSVMMWGIFSLLQPRGAGMTSYIKQLNDIAKEIDPMRPTVALSNKDGQINTITDLVAWRQNIGWESGFLNDISLWSNQIHSPKWSHLRSAVMYGAPGSVDHQIDRREIEKCRDQRLDGWYPEVRQSEMHEAYAKNIASDSLFWGVWHTTLFDYKAPRAILGENVDGLVSFDREDKKDAYFLYRALWNSDSPTLHIADKRARMVGDGSSRITLRVYASGEDEPVARVNGVEHQMKKVAPAQFILEDVEVRSLTKVVVTQGKLTDSVEFIYDSPLRNQRR